jgi:diguanylate cyclase (GGDEF)-like protein
VLNHRALVVNLRWLSILLAFGLVQLDTPAHFTNPVLASAFLAYMASNLVLGRLPDRHFTPHPRWFLLVLFDIGIVSLVIHELGHLRSDAFFLYLPLVAWAACHHGQRGIFATVGTAAAAYTAVVWSLHPSGTFASEFLGETGFLFRISLLVVIGVFFGYLAQRLRIEAVGHTTLAAERRDLEAVVTAAHHFSASLKQSEVLTRLIQEAVELVGAFRVTVVYVDEARTSGTLLISRELLEKKERLGTRTLRISLDNYPELTRALHTRGTVVINAAADEALLAPVMGKLNQVGIGSLLVVPMAIDDPMVGTLLLSLAREGEPFTPREVKLTELITTVSTNVLKNAYMHESLTHENLSLQKLAISDPLTGLYNRRFFDMRLSEEFRLAVRHRLPLSLVLLDIDHFKRINDTHGHPVGDRVLIKVAETVQASLRHSDCLARYGGEEFMLLLPLTDARGAQAKAEEIRLAIKEMAFGVEGDHLRLTVSLGVATYDGGGAGEPEALIAVADQALYTAKQGGRDQVRVGVGEPASQAPQAPQAPSHSAG